jgi:hypothetical protein
MGGFSFTVGRCASIREITAGRRLARKMMRSRWSALFVVYLLITALAIAADLRLSVRVVPAYHVTIWSGGKQFVAQGTTGAVSIRVPAGAARVRVIKTNSVSPGFRLESNGAAVMQSAQYGVELEATIPGDPGAEVELALKTN